MAVFGGSLGWQGTWVIVLGGSLGGRECGWLFWLVVWVAGNVGGCLGGGSFGVSCFVTPCSRAAAQPQMVLIATT